MLITKSFHPSWEPWLRTGAIALIDQYKTQISPRKGYSCPHRLLYGQDSCSDYVKQVFLEQSLSQAIHQSYRRFQDCNQARQVLQSQGGCLIIPCCLPIP